MDQSSEVVSCQVDENVFVTGFYGSGICQQSEYGRGQMLRCGCKGPETEQPRRKAREPAKACRSESCSVGACASTAHCHFLLGPMLGGQQTDLPRYFYCRWRWYFHVHCFRNCCIFLPSDRLLRYRENFIAYNSGECKISKDLVALVFTVRHSDINGRNVTSVIKFVAICIIKSLPMSSRATTIKFVLDAKIIFWTISLSQTHSDSQTDQR